MKGPTLIAQLILDEKLGKEEARRVAMLANLAEAGRPLAAAARAVGIGEGHARHLAERFKIKFRSGPG